MADFRGFIVILLGLFVVSCAYIDAKVDTTILDKICNGKVFEIYDFMTPRAMTTVVDAIVEGTPKTELLDYYKGNTVAGVYAHGVCARSLSSNECADCMKSASQQLEVNCPAVHIGAQIKLRDCKLRYEIYDFHDDL